MKYIAILDEEMLKDFRLDDRLDNKPGKLLVLEDMFRCTRAVELKPIKEPIVVLANGKDTYLTQGHIDAMIEYEQEQERESIRKEAEEWFARLENPALKANPPHLPMAEVPKPLRKRGMS